MRILKFKNKFTQSFKFPCKKEKKKKYFNKTFNILINKQSNELVTCTQSKKKIEKQKLNLCESKKRIRKTI